MRTDAGGGVSELIGSLASGMRGPIRGDDARGPEKGVLRFGAEGQGEGRSEPVDRSGECGQAVSFTVPGAPVGKQRARSRIVGLKSGKQFVSHYTPKETVNFENLVKIKAAEAMNKRAPFTGAVALTVSVYVTPPASWSERKKRMAIIGTTIPTTKPDLSNIIKAIEDGMNGIVYLDDKQISDYRRCIKRYDSIAGVVVEVVAL